MPIHDWRRVDQGFFHGLHGRWITSLTGALNNDILPEEYYADGEQIARDIEPGERAEPDVVTLRLPRGLFDPPAAPPGVAVADAPPRTRVRETLPIDTPPRRHLVVRHVSGDRVVALIEIVSPANKDRREKLDAFAGKVAAAIAAGIHVLVLDLFPPGRHDPNGAHDAIAGRLAGRSYELPPGDRTTLASYAAGGDAEAFVEHPAVGERLPDMPLFLTPDRYVSVPLEATYQAAWTQTPRHLRRVLEGTSAGPSPG